MYPWADSDRNLYKQKSVQTLPPALPVKQNNFIKNLKTKKKQQIKPPKLMFTVRD